MKLFISLFVFLFILSGCDTALQPIELDNPSIEFTMTGGIAGVHYNLLINEVGLATYKTPQYPFLTMQLAKDEIDSIKSYLKNFGSYEDVYQWSGVMDDFNFKITLKSGGNAKTVEFDGFSTRENSGLQKLGEVAGVLYSLCLRIYEQKATWTGLNYEFSLNKLEYSQQDTIKFICKIINPSNIEKKIFFRSKDPIGFYVKSASNIYPLLNYHSPVTFSDTTGAFEKILSPGANFEYSTKWNQKFNYMNKNYNGLPAGKYYASMDLYGGIYPHSKDILFEVK